MSKRSDVSPLLQALYEGRTADAEELLAESRQLDLFEAAAVGRTERVQELLASDPALIDAWSPDGFQALHLAAFFGRADAAEALLQQGADPATVSRHHFVKVTPLHSAVASEGAEDLRTVKTLLRHGAPVNAPAEGGGTPLHSAAFNGNAAIIEALVAHGADWDAADDDGKTPRDLARECSHDDLLEIAGSDARPS